MRKKLEARQQGLPEPEEEVPSPLLAEPKKKEPKKKTVRPEAVMHKLEPTPVTSSNSKFLAFSQVDDGRNEDVTSSAWLSSTAMKAKSKKQEQKKKEKERLLEEKLKAEAAQVGFRLSRQTVFALPGRVAEGNRAHLRAVHGGKANGRAGGREEASRSGASQHLGRGRCTVWEFHSARRPGRSDFEAGE